MNTKSPLTNVDSINILFPKIYPSGKLRDVLQEIPQFRRKEELVHMYVAYEFPKYDFGLFK